MARTFIDKAGQVITVAIFDKLSKDRKYYTLREFENDKFHVIARWRGIVENARNVPREYWKIWELQVFNILATDGEGNPYESPKRVMDKDATKSFHKQEDLLQEYKDFLVKYAGAEFKEEEIIVTEEGEKRVVMEVTEPGNKAASLSNDVPTVTEDTKAAEAVGSW